MTRTKLLLGFLAVAGAAAFAATAQAQTCAADKDCPQGFACVESGVVNGTAPACPPNTTDCPKPAPEVAPPTPIRTCQPKPCGTDADCGTGMVCYSESSSACSGSASVPPCAPGAECPPVKVDPPTCTTTTRKLCAFTWQLPCKADADCGAGFTCHPSQITSCSGSSGSGSGSSGGGTTTSGDVAPGTTGSGPTSGAGGSSVSSPTAPADAGTPCTTTTSFPGYCAPNATHCLANTDCPANWTCVQPPTPVTGTDTKAAPRPTDGGTTGDPTSDPATSPPALVPNTRVCAPPAGLSVRGDSSGIKGEGSGTPQTPTAGGTGLTGNGTGTGSGPSPIPPTTGGTSSSSPSTGGCSVQPSHDVSRLGGLGLMTLLGLMAVRRLRRR